MNSPMRHVENVRLAGAGQPLPGVPVAEAVTLNLCAVVLAMREDEPMVAVLSPPGHDTATLPCGPFAPSEHGTLKDGLASVIDKATGLRIHNSQALGTFGDGVLPQPRGDAAPVHALPLVSLCYLSLLPPEKAEDRGPLTWASWYDIFPWEDFRNGKPACLTDTIEPALAEWAQAGTDTVISPSSLNRSQRLRIAFGADGRGWDEEKVVERYDLLQEAGLIGDDAKPALGRPLWNASLGHHARVLASAIADLRRSIKSRPDVFELMPELFTLFELQKTVEGILGPHLHKQNFRRLVEGEGLVEQTSEYRQRTGGRPARLYRFRRSVLLERPAPGVRLKPGRAA